MKLFLQGGGGKDDSIELDKRFVAALDLSKPLLYIPIAIHTAEYPFSYPDCLAWIQDLFKPHGLTNIVMWVEEDLKNKTAADFEQFSGVYIGGGNTFKLLKELKEFGTFAILKKLLEKNIPIAGGSAGAIIFFKTIIPALSADPNNVELTDFTGMNLVNGYDLWCHYTPEMNPKIVEYKEKFKLEKIVAIPENAGLCVTDGVIEEIGPGKISYF